MLKKVLGCCSGAEGAENCHFRTSTSPYTCFRKSNKPFHCHGLSSMKNLDIGIKPARVRRQTGDRPGNVVRWTVAA